MTASQWNSSGIFHRIHHIAAQSQSSTFTVKIGWNTRELHWTNCLHVDVQQHFMGIYRHRERMRVKNAQPVSLSMQRDLEQDNGHFSVLVQRKSGLLSVKIVHKVNGTKWQRRWWSHSQKADTQSSVLRVRCPEVSSKAKAVENCRYTIVPIWKRFKLFENELKSYHNKTDWVNFVWMQDFWILLKSDSISWRKTLQNYHNSVQWLVVNTLCQEMKENRNQKVGSKETPALEVAACCLHDKYGVEIRIMSMNKDNSHSCFRISHGLCKLVTDLTNNKQETSEVQFEECVEIEYVWFCMPIEG